MRRFDRSAHDLAAHVTSHGHGSAPDVTDRSRLERPRRGARPSPRSRRDRPATGVGRAAGQLDGPADADPASCGPTDEQRARAAAAPTHRRRRLTADAAATRRRPPHRGADHVAEREATPADHSVPADLADVAAVADPVTTPPGHSPRARRPAACRPPGAPRRLEEPVSRRRSSTLGRGFPRVARRRFEATRCSIGGRRKHLDPFERRDVIDLDGHRRRARVDGAAGSHRSARTRRSARGSGARLGSARVTSWTEAEVSGRRHRQHLATTAESRTASVGGPATRWPGRRQVDDSRSYHDPRQGRETSSSGRWIRCQHDRRTVLRAEAARRPPRSRHCHACATRPLGALAAATARTSACTTPDDVAGDRGTGPDARPAVAITANAVAARPAGLADRRPSLPPRGDGATAPARPLWTWLTTQLAVSTLSRAASRRSSRVVTGRVADHAAADVRRRPPVDQVAPAREQRHRGSPPGVGHAPRPPRAASRARDPRQRVARRVAGGPTTATSTRPVEHRLGGGQRPAGEPRRPLGQRARRCAAPPRRRRGAARAGQRGVGEQRVHHARTARRAGVVGRVARPGDAAPRRRRRCRRSRRRRRANCASAGRAGVRRAPARPASPVAGSRARKPCATQP